MDDLIKRLQDVKRPTGKMSVLQDEPNGPWIHKAIMATDPLCAEAAAALTEAQETIARQQVMLDRALENGGDLMIENARLREALREVADGTPFSEVPSAWIERCVHKARAALSAQRETR